LCIAELETIRGNCAAALEHAELALQISERIGHRQWTVASHVTLGSAWLSLLHVEDARAHYEAALAVAHETRSVWWVGASSAMLASAYIAGGQYDAARETLQCAIDFDRQPSSLALYHCWYQQADLALATGRAADALALVEVL